MAGLRSCVAFALFTMASMLPVWGQQNFVTGPQNAPDSHLTTTSPVPFPLTITGPGTFSLAGGIFYMKAGTITTGSVTLTLYNSANVPLGSAFQTNSQFCMGLSHCQSYSYHTFTFSSPVTLSPGSYTLVFTTTATPEQNNGYFVKNDGKNLMAGPMIPSLLVSKTASTFTSGNQATYAVQVINVGSAPSSGAITVSDTLDPNLTFVSATGSGWICNAVVTCTTSAAIPAGGSAPLITITVNVAAHAEISVTNSVTVSGGGSANNSFQLVTPVSAPDLSVLKTANPATFTQGQNGVVYTITVINGGTAPTSGAITVTDTLDPNLTFVTGSVTGTGWSCSVAAKVVTCTSTGVVIQPMGGTSTFTFTVNVSANAPASVTNNVTVTGGGGVNTNNTFQLVSTVNAPKLSVSKAAMPSAFSKGMSGSYTILVNNSGTAPSSGTITVTDTLDPNLTYGSAAGSNWSCSAATPVVTCTTTATIAPGSSAPAINITVNVASGAPTMVTNSVTVSGGGSANNSSQLVTAVDATDLRISKTATPTTFTQGQNAVYTITATNIGNADSSGPITVTDALDPNLTYVSAAPPSGWMCSAAAQLVTCTTSTAIAKGASVSINITVNVAANGQISAKNTVTISGGGDVNPTNTTFTLVSVVNSSNLHVSKTATPATFTQGQNGVIYTIQVNNVGNAPSSGTITVTDTLDPNLTYVSAAGSNWSCSAAAQVVTCTSSTAIAAGASSSITIAVNVAAHAGTSATNSVTVAGGGGVNTNNSFQLVSNVVPALFTIQVTGGGSQSTAISTAFGQSLEATVKDSNGNPVSGVTVTFTVPTSGASATLSSPTAVTDANGHAIVTATANGNAGSYNVTATGAGATGTANFSLTNTSSTSAQAVPATTTPMLILAGIVLIGIVVWLRWRAAYSG